MKLGDIDFLDIRNMEKRGILLNKVDERQALARDGYEIGLVTCRDTWHLHYHKALEIIFILNGHAAVEMDGRKYRLSPLDFLVIDSMRPHEVVYSQPQSMGMDITISKRYMRKFVSDLEYRRIECYSGEMKEPDEQMIHLMLVLKELTILSMEQKTSWSLQVNGRMMELIALLVEHFSTPMQENLSEKMMGRMERLSEIFQFTQEHHREPVSLQDAADHMGLNKEYFCRYFKKNMGISYLKYLSNVRLHHIYQDLLYSDAGVREIAEDHGFTNQKFFYEKFKEKYECTPRELRKMAKNNPYIR